MPINRSFKLMKCQNCGGTMQVDKNRSLLSCPYCSSSELILETDRVTIKRIKYETRKEERINRENAKLEKKRLEQERIKLVIPLLALALLAYLAFLYFATSRL